MVSVRTFTSGKSLLKPHSPFSSMAFKVNVAMNGKTYKVESDNEELAGHSIGMLSQEQLFQVILMATNSQSPVQVIKQAFVV